jgi:hypothetical protein
MTKVLLVEGASDKDLLDSLLKKINFPHEITVTYPQEDGTGGRGKDATLARADLYLKQLAASQISHLGMVLDADNNQGFKTTLQKVLQILTPFGYKPEADVVDSGLLFSNSDGLPPFGLWIMPNNKDDGMLEDFLKNAATQEQLPLLQHAQKTVSDLNKHNFKIQNISKTEVATWMAWQKKPIWGLKYFHIYNTIDLSHPTVAALQTWLKKLYT